MSKEQTPKHHRICMKCRVQSMGKSVKECEESFPKCGLNGGVPNNACKTTILQDGNKVFEIIPIAELTKLKEDLKLAQKESQANTKPFSTNSKKKTNSKKNPKN